MRNLHEQRREIAVNKLPIEPPHHKLNPTTQRARGLTSPFLATNQSLQVLPIDFDRRYLMICNNDPLGILYLSFGLAGVYGSGIVINPNGGYFLADYNCPTAQAFLVGSIALNQNVSITTA